MGKPTPHKNTHKSYDKTELARPGERLHIDMVYINDKRYILCVDEATGYLNLDELKHGAESDQIAHSIERIIMFYQSNHHVTKEVFSDNAFEGIEHMLVRYRIKHKRYIPDEHERIAERSMGTIRRRMKTKIAELKYDLGNAFYKYLALDVIRKLNMTTNIKTLPLIPIELVEGRRVNYTQDLAYNFGSPVLCPSYGAGVSADIGICLGISINHKGGILVWIPGSKQPMVRRGIKAMPLTEQLKELLNRMFDGDKSYAKLFHYKKSPQNTENIMENELEQVAEIRETDADSPGKQYDNEQPVPQDGTKTTQRHDPGVYNSADNITEREPTQEQRRYQQQTEQDPIQRRYQRQNTGNDPTLEHRQQHESNSSQQQDSGVSNTIEPPPTINYSPEIKEPETRKSGRVIRPVVRATACITHQETWEEQLNGKHSKLISDAITKELEQLIKMKTWTPIKSLEDAAKTTIHKSITGSKLIVKEKTDANGATLLWKARLVAQGHTISREKYDPFDRTAHTVPTELVFTQVAIATHEGLAIETFDVPGAYLHASLKDGKQHVMRIKANLAPFVVKLSPTWKEFVQRDGSMIVLLNKSLYGLPEAGQLWQEYLGSVLHSLGYKRCPHEPCIYRKLGSNSKSSTVSIHVDDVLHTYNCESLRSDLYKGLDRHNLKGVKISKLSLGHDITHLGMNLRKEQDGGVVFSQYGFIKKLLLEHKPTGERSTPASEHILDDYTGTNDERLGSNGYYLSKLMSLYYLASRTRPDILPACSMLSTKSANPKVGDMKALQRIIDYVAGTIHRVIRIKATSTKIHGLVDCAFGIHWDRRSHSGMLITMGFGGPPIMWRSGKQRINTRHSTEGELVAMHDFLDHVLWLAQILEWWGHPQGTIPIYQDNTSTITIAYMGKGSAHSHTRYIAIKYFWIKQFLDSGRLILKYIPRDQMIADFFTSCRGGATFHNMTDTFMFDDNKLVHK
jgi:hypothetical protein